MPDNNYKHLKCFVMLGTHSELRRGQMSHICDISALSVKHPKLPVCHRQLRAGGNLERQTRTISQSSPLDGLIRLRDRCLPQEKNALRGPQKPNTSILTAKTSLYTIGAGITTIAVPDLPSNFFFVKEFGLYKFQLPDHYSGWRCYLLSLPP